MRFDSRSLVPLMLAAALSTGAGLEGQERSLFIRFDPRPGFQVRTAVRLTGEVAYVGLPALPDSAKANFSLVGGLTREVLDVDSGVRRVKVTVDSLVGRHETGDQAPTVFDFTRLSGLSVEEVLDPALGSSGSDPTVEAVHALGLAGEFRLSLPVAPIAEGGSWSADLILPFSSATANQGDLEQAVMLTASVRATLDSLRPRGSDSLAYVSFRGAVTPLNLDRPDGRVSFRGSVAGRTVWSTGWNWFVSAALQSRVVQTVTDSSGQELTLIFRQTNYHQVRP